MSSPQPGKKPPSGPPSAPDKIASMETESRQTGTPYSRIAAALDYAQLDNRDAAAALGISVTTVSRLRSGGKTSPQEPESYYRAVAKATGAPLWFLEHGFDGYRQADEEPTLRDEVEAVRHELTTLRGQQRESREEVAALEQRLRTLQLGIAEAVAGHVEDLVRQQEERLHGASDEAPQHGQQEGS